MGNPGKPVVGIPRWLTGANLLGIVLAFTLAIPFGAHANHQTPPSNLTITRVLPAAGYAWTAGRLAWSDSALGTTQYRLQRSPNGDFSPPVVEYPIARNTFQFYDESFTPVGTFYYRVRSVAGADQSNFSNRVSMTNTGGTLPASAPAVPTELATESVSGGVAFSWKDNASNETFFRVERGTAEQGGQNITWEWRGNKDMASGTGSRVSFTDSDGVVGNVYRVTVFNGRGSNRSYAQAHTQPGVPGVSIPPNVVPSSIGVPSNLQTLLPSDAVGTVTGIVSPLASNATGLLSNVPAPSGVVSSLNGLTSTATQFASALASPFVSLATGAVGTAGSVIANPTSALAPLDNIKIWFALRLGGVVYFPSPNGAWVWPPACAQASCPVPSNEPTFVCNPIGPGVEYCFMIKLA